ncbi:MAG: hypothetical protein LBQ87_03535 [Candidatus Fibromonas sp.]|jgi:predicted membrane channel-forming protein YqfA (hemolysin III family)|nr:hypothetical protein [Candidatus Fibromonas sp.]
MNYVVVTYLIRFLGILLIVPAIFPVTFANWFPGLEDRRIGWVFFGAGTLVYIGASITYAILSKKESVRRRSEMEKKV